MRDIIIFSRRGGDAPTRSLPPGYTISAFDPSPLALHAVDDQSAPPTLLHLYWYFVSINRYRIFYVRKDRAIVHVSYVLSRNPRFAFMARDDLEIGPCRTEPVHRGQGCYVGALSHIIDRYPERRLWIFAGEDNETSMKGIESAGFGRAGRGRRSLGIYHLVDVQENP